MILVDKPYVSRVLAETLVRMQVPVLKYGTVDIPDEADMNQINEKTFFDHYQPGSLSQQLLCNSENPLQLLVENNLDERLSQIISVFKDKLSFRNMLHTAYPDFKYGVVSLFELNMLFAYDLPYPFIIKPVIGYSSIGVYLIRGPEELPEIVEKLKKDVDHVKSVYPSQVVNMQYFIIEQWIEGQEYALDAYFTKEGEPVILNLFKRMFAQETDTSDRIYYTNRIVFKEMLQRATDFLRDLGGRMDLRGIPIHLELRLTRENMIIPIEVNPLRFMGVGTTELGIHAYDVNAYEYFFQQWKPDWEKKMEQLGDDTYSFFCAEFPMEIVGDVDQIDTMAFKSNFSDILEYREMPYKEYPGFAIVFYRSSDLKENQKLIHLDVTPYLKVNHKVMA